jgi:hypothetical protein
MLHVGKEVFYRKIGRKYVPVSEWDSHLMDAMPQGSHLIQVYPGGKSTRYNVDPNYAAMIAAGRVAENAVSNAIMQATELRQSYKMRQHPITPEQKAAWERLVEVFGDEAKALEWPSAREAAEAAVKAMTQEAEKIMAHPEALKAFERFVLEHKDAN